MLEATSSSGVFVLAFQAVPDQNSGEVKRAV
jgi:hypothetical protein